MTLLDNLFTGIAPVTATQAANVTAARAVKVPLALPLKDFQEDAVDHALRDTVTQGYAYLALDMGLGKTACAIAIAAAMSAVGVPRTLIVVPPSLRINWEREFVKFAPWLKVYTIRGARPCVDELPDADVYLTGFASLIQPTQTATEKRHYIIPKGWTDIIVGNVNSVIVDEAHYIKNKSGRSKAVKLISDSLTKGVRILMSGTPTPNGQHRELATQIAVLGQRAWRDIGGEGRFWHHYAPKADEYGGRVSHDAEGLFTAMSSTWYYRRLRSDVIELPNKGRSILSMEAKGKAARDYVRAEDDLIEWLQEEGRDTRGAARAEALVRLTTLRRLAGEAKVSEAAAHVKELLSEEPGGVFVVAEHRDVMDDLMLRLVKYNPTTVQGGMTDSEKQENIDAFCSGKSRVLVGQIQAAGVGLTLHGDGRNRREVVVQIPWTPAALLQVEDRLHRMGQTKDVEIEICLAAIEGRWTIDERLWNLVNVKAFAASSITDGHGSFLLGEAVEGLLDSYRN
jgi:SWI/SNF-related matrix-associated actin-dependent regulator 1 of chromatin subfamily A